MSTRRRTRGPSTRFHIGLLLAILVGLWTVGALWHRSHLPLLAQSPCPLQSRV